MVQKSKPFTVCCCRCCSPPRHHITDHALRNRFFFMLLIKLNFSSSLHPTLPFLLVFLMFCSHVYIRLSFLVFWVVNKPIKPSINNLHLFIYFYFKYELSSSSILNKITCSSLIHFFSLMLEIYQPISIGPSLILLCVQVKSPTCTRSLLVQGLVYYIYTCYDSL